MGTDGGRGPTWAWLAGGSIALIGLLSGMLWSGMDSRVTDHEERLRALENHWAIVEGKLDRALEAQRRR